MRFEVGDTVYIAFEIDDKRMVNKNPFKIEGIDIKIRKNYKNTTYLLTNGVICSEDNISIRSKMQKNQFIGASIMGKFQTVCLNILVMGLW